MKPSFPRRLKSSVLSVVLLSACHAPDGETSSESTPHSERAGIGMRTRTQEVVSPSQVIDSRRSLAVTEIGLVSRFPLAEVMDQLAAQTGNPDFTGERLFRQLWETQNSTAGAAELQPSAHCSDNDTTLNGFPNLCRPIEGAQANASNNNNITTYLAIGLFNRFDLAPETGANCGEYRIVFGNRGSTPGSRSNFIIFEAVLPNPRPDLRLEGCRPVQAFWRDLATLADNTARLNALHDFYFNGLPGFAPVIQQENYGANAKGVGQIRVNMFLEPRWDLKEFKLQPDCGADSCTLKAVPVAVKVNPFGGLFDSKSTHPLTGEFQSHFLTQVAGLAVNDVNKFNYEVPDRFNAAHSDAQSSPSTTVKDDYVASFAGPSAFRDAIQSKLDTLGSPLTPDQIVARAQALSCGGCHQRSAGRPMGGDLTFPRSINFVHSTMVTETAPDGATRFLLSEALTQTFLPFRKGLLEDFLSDAHPVTPASRSNMVDSAVDDQHVYWVEDREDGVLMRASLNSGSEQVLASGRVHPTAVATDGINLYWTEAAGSVFKVPVAGGTITSLVTGLTGLSGIATDGTHVFWTQGGTSIVRMPVNGGARRTVISGRTGLTGRLAVDGTQLYWQEADSLLAAAKTGGTASPLLTRPAIADLATDGTHVYFVENSSTGNTISRLPVGGGKVAQMNKGPRQISSLSVGSTNFAWTPEANQVPVITRVKN